MFLFLYLPCSISDDLQVGEKGNSPIGHPSPPLSDYHRFIIPKSRNGPWAWPFLLCLSFVAPELGLSIILRDYLPQGDQ